MNILKTIELYTLNGYVIYSSIKLLLKLRNGCLELPADNEVVSWAQWAEYWDCCPATGTGWGASGSRGASICHLSLTGTKILICPGRCWDY